MGRLESSYLPMTTSWVLCCPRMCFSKQERKCCQRQRLVIFYERAAIGVYSHQQGADAAEWRFGSRGVGAVWPPFLR